MVHYKVYKEGKTESIVIERKNKHGKPTSLKKKLKRMFKTEFENKINKLKKKISCKNK